MRNPKIILRTPCEQFNDAKNKESAKLHTDELRSEVEQSDVDYSHTKAENDDFSDVANINIVAKKKVTHSQTL